MQLHQLSELAAWPPVAALAERVLTAMQGGEGLDRSDVRRLASWGASWRQYRPELRDFYREALSEVRPKTWQAYAINAGLWSLISHHRAQPEHRGQLARIYNDLRGLSPEFPLTGEQIT